MSGQRLFGTDGIRGRAGEYPLDVDTVVAIGRALASDSPGRVIIGRDTRISGVWIEDVLEESLAGAGVAVEKAGVLTTPGISYLTSHGPFRTGIVVSASHNPYRDNGIKFFQSDGSKFNEEMEQDLERRILRAASGAVSPHRQEMPSRDLLEANSRCQAGYEAMLAAVPDPTPLSGLKVVLDCANGAAYRIAPRIFRSLGAQVEALNVSPNGRNINEQCGALHPQEMAQRVVETGARLGAAFDGDADRVIFSDEQGRLLDGDHVLLALARYLKRCDKLPSNTVVTTVMANMGLEEALGREGIGMIRTSVGDRRVWEAMQSGDHALGGEQSGHVIVREYLPAGDGILVALKMASLVAGGECLLSQVAESLVKYPQLIVNVPVARKVDFREIPSIAEEIDRIEKRLASNGRLLVRYSGTEPLVRIMIEGKPGSDLKSDVDSIADRFREALGSEL